MLGSVIGGQICVQPKAFDWEWVELCNLWGDIVARPGAMKSPSIGAVLSMLTRLVQKERSLLEQKQAEWKVDNMEVEENRKADEKEFSKVCQEIKTIERGAKTDTSKLAELEKRKAQLRDLLVQSSREKKEPTARRFIVNEFSYEKFLDILADNPLGILLYRDELGGLLAEFSKEERSRERTVCLEGWAGKDSKEYDTFKHQTIFVERNIISMLGGIQPGKIAPIVNAPMKDPTKDDGLPQRLGAAVYPDLPNKEPKDYFPDQKANSTAWKIFESLSEIVQTGKTQTITLKGPDRDCNIVEREIRQVQLKIRAYKVDPVTNLLTDEFFDRYFWADKSIVEKSLPRLRFAPEAQPLLNDWIRTLKERLQSPAVTSPPPYSKAIFRNIGS